MKRRIRKKRTINTPREALNTYNHKPKYYLNYQSLNWILSLIVVISIVWVSYKIREWMYDFCCYPLSYVIVTGKRYYTTNTDINQLIIQLGTLGTFLTQDVDVIQKQIECLPWIQQVSVRKQWPDTLKIHIVEHVPLVRWNESQIISVTGTIFAIPKECPNNNIKLMPVLYGPEGSASVVLNNYYVFNEILKSSEFQIKSVKMDMRCSWQIVLHNNIHLKLGRNNIIERLYYFVKIYPILLQKINEKNKYIDYIDLRYQSGFAVKWVSNSITSVFCNE